MDSVEQWWTRVEEKRQAAAILKGDKKAAREAWNLVGEAVEFALKAVIMKRQRFNRWPDRNTRPELHSHNLRDLIEFAGIEVRAKPLPLRANFKVVCDWNRGHDYTVNRMPRKVAEDMFNSAFGEEGVVTWLKKL